MATTDVKLLQSSTQWEQSPRLRQIKMKLHKFREYVRIYLLSNVDVTRDNSVYVSMAKQNAPERPYMMHKVCKQATNLQIYDYFLKEPRPIPDMSDNIFDQDLNYYVDKYNVYSEEATDSDRSDSSDLGIFGEYIDNMMFPLKSKRNLNRIRSRSLHNKDAPPDNQNVFFRFKFKCLHRQQKGYSSEMTEFGEHEYQFHLKLHAMFVVANITNDQASVLEVDAGRPSYIPVVHLFNHWLNDLQILPFNHVITFVNDIITTSLDIDELLLESASIHMIVTDTLASIKRTWDQYPDTHNINAKDKHYGRDASYQSNLSHDPYELRNRNNKNETSVLNMFAKKKEAATASDAKDARVNELKKILFRKFLFLFIIGSKIDYHHIRQNKKDEKKNKSTKRNYKRVFDCSLLYWFVRSIYYFQRASIPYILALFRDECDIMGLNILWEAIQINVKCCCDFETFLYLAPFINFFDAIDCFLRSSDQKRSIQSPEILKSNQRTQRTAKLVLKMIEIDLSLPVPSNRRFPVEGILLAKMSSRTQHQSEFINLLKTIAKTTAYWDHKEKTQYLTSMFQRHHHTISRILDWNWGIHDHYYTFCQINEVLHIGTATQENNLVTKMKALTMEQFNDTAFRQFVEKWYESIFNQQVTDALMSNTHIDSRSIRKLLHYKVRKSISYIQQSPGTNYNRPPTGDSSGVLGPKTGSMMATYHASQPHTNFNFYLDSPQFAPAPRKMHSSSVSSVPNYHTVEWYANIMLNETSDAIILMIENFVKQRKDELALNLLRHLLATDKHNHDIFDQLSVLIANPHYYRLPLVFQQLLGKILSYIHWFPPEELNEIPPGTAHMKSMPSNVMCPVSPIKPSWGHIADLPDSKPDSSRQLLGSVPVTEETSTPTHNRIIKLCPSTNPSNRAVIPQSRTSRTSLSEEASLPPSPDSRWHPRPPLTALNMMSSQLYNHSNKQLPKSSKSITPINRFGSIRPGSVLDNQNRRKRKRADSAGVCSSNGSMQSSRSLAHELEEKSVSPSTDNIMDMGGINLLQQQISNLAVKAISPNGMRDEKEDEDEEEEEKEEIEQTGEEEDVILNFTTHVLTFEEKKEMMLWLNDYGSRSLEMEMYVFWDGIFMNIIELPPVIYISNYDASLFSDASQILSPKMHETIKGHFFDDQKQVSQDPDESRIDLILTYIMNEYEKINDEGTNIYKLNVLHNQITVIFEDLDQIISFGIRGIEFMNTKQQTNPMDAPNPLQSSPSPPPPPPPQPKLIFLTERFQPWVRCVMESLRDQLKSGHLLVKTLEYIANAEIIDTKLAPVLAFAGLQFNDTDIKQRLKLLKDLQSDIRCTEYTDDLKQRIKQNIVQWDYLTLLQVDQLITTLLNDDTKAPTNLRVLDRVGNIIRLHWVNPPRGRLEYVQYEVSQQLCRKEGNDAEYLDPSTHLLGSFNVHQPPIQVTINLTNLVIIPSNLQPSKSKPVVATNCLLRIRGVTIKQEIKSAWSDSIDVAICNTQSIEHTVNQYVEHAQQSVDRDRNNIDFYALQAMIDDGFNYEKTEIDAIASTLGKEMQKLQVLIQNAQDDLKSLQAQESTVEKRNQSLPIQKEKCNESLAKLNTIYTASVHELEDNVGHWSVEDCLYWFDRVGLCRFAKYHSILLTSLNAQHVQKFLNFTIQDLHQLGIGNKDNDNDCQRILHYIHKCKKKYQKKISKQLQQQLNMKESRTNNSHKTPMHPAATRSKTHPIAPNRTTNTTQKPEASSMPTHPNQKHVINTPKAIAIHANLMAAAHANQHPMHKSISILPSTEVRELSPPRSPHDVDKNKRHNRAQTNTTVAQPRTNYQHPLSIYHTNANANGRAPNNFSHRALRSYNPSDMYRKQLPPPPKGSPPHNSNHHNHNNLQRHTINMKEIRYVAPAPVTAPPFPAHLQYKANPRQPVTTTTYDHNRNNNMNNMWNRRNNGGAMYRMRNGVSVPMDFVCPISGELMKEPVMASDGQTYEKLSMEMWLKTHDTSPVFHGQRLRNKFLMPYNELAARINVFKMQHSIQ